MEKPENLYKTPLDYIITIVGLAMVVYQGLSTQIAIVSPAEHQNIHLAFSLSILFLVAVRSTRGWRRTASYIMLALSLIGTIYVFLNFQELDSIFDYPNTLQLIIGVILIVVVLEATRRLYGLILPILALIFVAYAFWGNYLPGPFHTANLRPEMVISRLSIGISGIYGMTLGISANYIFLFIVFGSLLQISGATNFFHQIGRVLGKRFRGGPALSAVFCSMLMGMVTGGPTANVAVVGPFTIPLMKRVGYKPYQAAAIEAAASTGGSIMPPVMGAVAFVMAGFTGIPYARIALVAVIPALLYYFSIALYAQFQAMKLNVLMVDEEPDKREMLLSGPIFFIPLISLTAFLIMEKTLMFAIFWTVIITFIVGNVRTSTRPSLKQWMVAFVEGAIGGAQIAAVCALIGLIVTPITMTGIGIKLPAIVEMWSHGSLTLALIITMIVSLILGTGLPTTPTYVLVAIITAPVLQKMGCSLLQAHFFAFYFACIAFVTPPEAMAALVASKLAGSSFMRTGWESCLVALGGFLVPFLGIWAPVIMLAPQSLASGILDMIFVIVLLIAAQAVICDYYLTALTIPERVILAAVPLAIIAFFVLRIPFYAIAGGAGFLVITLEQGWKMRVARRINSRSPLEISKSELTPG